MNDTGEFAPIHPRLREPEGFQWGRFRAADGTSLRWGRLTTANPTAHCVVVGGFCEFTEKYFETLQDLAARGFSVWSLDWRGQGGSDRPQPQPTRPRPRDFNRDADDLAAFTAAHVPATVPRVLIGHSMGGAIALLCLKRHLGLFTTAILSAPMIAAKTRAVPSILARLLCVAAILTGCGGVVIPGTRIWPTTPARVPVLGGQASSDRERGCVQWSWFAAQPGLAMDGPTFAWLWNALRLGDRLRRRELLTSITTPILIGSAGIDAFVDPAAHRHAAGLLPRCDLFEMPQARHELFMESDPIRDLWLGKMMQFIGVHADGPAP